MSNGIQNEKVAYILAKERIVEGIPEEFQNVGFFDEDFFYENFFKKQFPKDIVKDTLTRLERKDLVRAYMIKECFNCGEEVFKLEENFFDRETYTKITTGEELFECPFCQHSIDFTGCDWKFAFSQEVLKEGEEIEEDKGFLQKFCDFFRVGR